MNKNYTNFHGKFLKTKKEKHKKNYKKYKIQKYYKQEKFWSKIEQKLYRKFSKNLETKISKHKRLEEKIATETKKTFKKFETKTLRKKVILES